jgi:hypothetical protein
MLPDRYYVADVHEGSKVRRLYFYASVEGLTDPEYGYSEDNSWIEPAYKRAVNEIERGLDAEPGAAVSVSESHEISLDELVKQDPEVNVHILKAITVAKEEIRDALHPIKVIWYWQASDDVGKETAVHLILEDDTVFLPVLFGLSLQQLSNESLMKERIRRLYQDLLAIRSRTLIKNLLRGNVGAGRD